MTVETGLSENIELIDQNGTNIQDLFGGYASASVIIDESNRREGTIGNDGKALEISDGPVENRGTITCKPETLEILKIMGSYDSNAGTISFDKFLPELNALNVQHTANERFHFEDLKVGGFSLGASIDETVTIEFSPIHAKTGEIQEQTVDVAPVKGSPLQWTDTVVKVDGTEFGLVESVAGDTLNRNINAEHALGQGREPAEITEGEFNIQPSFVVKVQDSSAWEELLDETSYPLSVQDQRSPVSEISFDFGDGNGELVITNAKAEINTFDMDEEKDTRTIELSFNGESISVRNL